MVEHGSNAGDSYRVAQELFFLIYVNATLQLMDQMGEYVFNYTFEVELDGNFHLYEGFRLGRQNNNGELKTVSPYKPTLVLNLPNVG